MDVREYCTHVDIEITTWRAKFYSIINNMDLTTRGDNQRIYEIINNIKIIMNDLEDRIAYLRTSCHSEWHPTKEEIEEKIFTLEEKYKEAEGLLVDYDMNN